MEEEIKIKEEYLNSIVFPNANVNTIYKVNFSYYIPTQAIFKINLEDDYIYLRNMTTIFKICKDEDSGRIYIADRITREDLYAKLEEDGVFTLLYLGLRGIMEESVPYLHGNTVGRVLLNSTSGFNVELDNGTDRFIEYEVEVFNVDSIRDKVLRVDEYYSFDYLDKRIKEECSSFVIDLEAYKTFVKFENTTINNERVNFLADEVLKLHSKENVTINLSENNKTVELVIKYPNLIITNEQRETIGVEDLFVSIPFSAEVAAFNDVWGARTSFTSEDITGWYRDCCDERWCSGCDSDDDEIGYINTVALYSHSHLDPSYTAEFSMFCLGDTPFSIMSKRWRNPSEDFPLQAVLYILEEYIKTESIAGGPHVNMGSVGGYATDSTIPANISENSASSVLTQYLNRYNQLPLIVDGNKNLCLNLENFEKDLNYLAVNEILPDNSFGKIDNRGIVMHRNKPNGGLPEEVIEYIEYKRSYVKFKNETVPMSFEIMDTRAEDKTKYTVWPEIVEKLQKRINFLLKTNKFNEYVKENHSN